MKPPPGSAQALQQGCRCPVIDNHYGRGAYGGVRDENGDVVYVLSMSCPVHSEGGWLCDTEGEAEGEAEGESDG